MQIYFFECRAVAPRIERAVSPGRARSLACLRGQNGSGIYVMKVMYPPVGQRGASAVFKRVIPLPGAGRVKAMIFMGD